jgi:hypothetical protein
MPIGDKLQKTFVPAQETDTVAQVLDAWQKAGGQGWWTLLVAKSDRQTVATTFNELDALLDKLGPALFAARLGDLPLPLTPCVTVEVEAADERMSRREMLVVTSKGKPIGFMAEAMRSAVVPPSSRRRERLDALKQERTTRGEKGMISFSPQEGFAASSLVELYGEYVKLGEDKRAQWQPAALPVPVQQPCGHTAWPELNDRGKWVCGQCKKLVRT